MRLPAAAAALCLFLPALSWARDDRFRLLEAEVLRGNPVGAIRLNDVLRSGEVYAQGGGDLMQQFVKFLFPTSGREQRTMFMPLGYWGMKKPQYKRFDWHRFESEHFNFYTYPDGEVLIQEVVSFLEDEHEANNRIFGVENRFTKKIPVIFYMSRRDFEQSTILEGPIPEGLGGVTELFSWKRMTFPFEGERAQLEHVAKHEGTHVYQIAKEVRKLPLWFVEGAAETNSIRWDADAEMVLRDAFLNGLIPRIADLWQIEGTWLMYKVGNFITNLIWDDYGEAGFKKIFDRAKDTSFEENLKLSLGLTPDELDRRVTAELARRYGPLLDAGDLREKARVIRKRETLLHSRGRFFLSGGASGPREALFLNHLENDGKVTRKSVVEDRRFRNESLYDFRSGAFLNDTELVYAIRRSRRDVLRVVGYRFEPKERKFSLGEPREFSFENLPTLGHPVLIGPSEVAFVGYKDGFADLYRYDWAGKNLRRLTSERRHCSDLDYSAARGEIVFSREDGKSSGRTQYDRNLYRLDLKSGDVTAVTATPLERETRPRYSPDGRRLLFVSDADGTPDLYLYTFDGGRRERLTRMRIGLANPGWAGEDSLFYEDFEELAPSIYLAPLPDAEDRLTLRRPLGDPVDVRLEPSGVRLEPPEKSEESTTPPEVSEGISVRDGNLEIGEHGKVSFVDRLAFLPDRVLLQAAPVKREGKTKELDEKPRYFEWGSEGLRELRSKVYASPEEAREWETAVRQALGGREIINLWADREVGKVFVEFNNRLAPSEEKERKRPDVGLGVYETGSGGFNEFEDVPIEGVKERIQWVSFLAGGRVLLARGSMPYGPFDLFLLKVGEKKSVTAARAAEQFRVSPDRGRLAWRSETGTVTVREVKTGEERVLAGIGAWAVQRPTFEFLQDSRIEVMSPMRKKWLVRVFDPWGVPAASAEIPRDPGERYRSAAIDPASGNVVLLTETREKKERVRRLTVWRAAEKKRIPIAEGRDFERIVFRQGYLDVVEKRPPPEEDAEWIWDGRGRFFWGALRSAAGMPGGTLVETPKELAFFEPDRPAVSRVSGPTQGYATAGREVIVSEPEGDLYQLFRYDTRSKQKARWVSSTSNDVGPVLSGDAVFWSREEEKGWSVFQKPLAGESSGTRIAVDGYDLLDPETRGDTATTARAHARPAKPEFEPRAERMLSYPRLLTPERTSGRYRLQQLALAAAYDGSHFRYFVSGYADNLFSDRGLYVDAIFVGSSNFATAGYTDLRTGRTYSLFFNSRDNIKNGGLNVARSFTLDRYREFTVYGQYEVQSYGAPDAETAAFVTPDVANRRFHLVKLGAAYAYDVTLWDDHGPTSGSRFFLKSEAGVDAGRGGWSNTDANLDFRVYHRLLPRFGFAHRIVAGTSQGNLPSVFLLGGNLSFRGVGFDDLKGQNYWVFSEDLRIPVFDFIGAKFFDPLDRFIGFFARYFDVRGGIYADVGQIWFNGRSAAVKYSVGYFVNVPTIFGLQFRLSQGFAGETGMDFWFGVNW